MGIKQICCSCMSWCVASLPHSSAAKGRTDESGGQRGRRDSTRGGMLRLAFTVNGSLMMQSTLTIIPLARSPWSDWDFSFGFQDARPYCTRKWLHKWQHTVYSAALQLIIHCVAPFIDDVLHIKSIKLGCLNKRAKAILMYTESTNTETAHCFSFSSPLSLRPRAGGDSTLVDCMFHCFKIWRLMTL